MREDGPLPMSDDGLLQRFQLLIWPDVSRDPGYIDRAPDAAALRRVERLFRES
jgi:hypothetical protein